jgi:hypothetical protein
VSYQKLGMDNIFLCFFFNSDPAACCKKRVLQHVVSGSFLSISSSSSRLVCLYTFPLALYISRALAAAAAFKMLRSSSPPNHETSVKRVEYCHACHEFSQNYHKRSLTPLVFFIPCIHEEHANGIPIDKRPRTMPTRPSKSFKTLVKRIKCSAMPSCGPCTMRRARPV